MSAKADNRAAEDPDFSPGCSIGDFCRISFAGFSNPNAELVPIMPEPMNAPDADISRFFTNMDESVFALKNLPEEVVAYLFARYSRSRLSLRDDLRNMIEAEDLGALIGPGSPDDPAAAVSALQERARAFAEKYVLGYGHSSVAEHGVVHLALEDVSIIASKLIEDARLASYTEKSTRYVAFDPTKVYYPANVMADAKLAADYTLAVRGLLEAYTGWTEDFVAQIKARTPRSEKQSERTYEAASRATAFDLLRYLLPTATHTNVGLTLNARALAHLITKLLSQPLAEGRALGERIKAEAQQVVPTLLKYADPNAYRAETSEAIALLAAELLETRLMSQDLTPELRSDPLLNKERVGAERPGEVSAVSLLFSDPDAEDQLVAAILYGDAQMPMETLLARVKTLEHAAKERVVDEYLSRRGKHDAPGRALERLFCTIEMTMDYGAYRDVQRHRMATQTTQTLSPALGFERPREFETFGYAARYDNLMAQSAATYARLCDAGFVHEAAYVLPLATRIRVLFTWNLREVTHFVELRSARQGHPSYRKIAQEVYHAAAASYPLIARYMRPNLNTYALTRE
jgi:thymidylate synthase ThyX